MVVFPDAPHLAGSEKVSSCRSASYWWYLMFEDSYRRPVRNVATRPMSLGVVLITCHRVRSFARRRASASVILPRYVYAASRP